MKSHRLFLTSKPLLLSIAALLHLSDSLAQDRVWIAGNGTWTQPDSTNWNATYTSGQSVFIPYPTTGFRFVFVSGNLTPGNITLGGGAGTGDILLSAASGNSISGNGSLFINANNNGPNSGFISVYGNNNFSGGTTILATGNFTTAGAFAGVNPLGTGPITIQNQRVSDGSYIFFMRSDQNFPSTVLNNPITVIPSNPTSSSISFASFNANVSPFATIVHNGNLTHFGANTIFRSNNRTITYHNGTLTQFGVAGGVGNLTFIFVGNYSSPGSDSEIYVNRKISSPSTSGIVRATANENFISARLFLLNNLSDFIQPFQVDSGARVIVSSIANSGVPSAIGAGDVIRLLDEPRLEPTRLRLASNSSQSTNRLVEVGGNGTVRLNIHNGFSGSLNLTGCVTQITPTNTTLMIWGDPAGSFYSGNVTISGNITENPSGVLKIVKTGYGLMTLSGNNSYSGGTEIIHAGFAEFANRLRVLSSSALGSGNVTINSSLTSAALFVGNFSNVANNILMMNNGTGSALISVDSGSTISGNITLGSFSSTNARNMGFSLNGVNSSTPAVLSGNFIAANSANLVFFSSYGRVDNRITSNSSSGFIIFNLSGNFHLTNPTSSFSGNVIINSGTVVVPSISNVGLDSPLGSGSRVTLQVGSTGTPRLLINGTLSSTSNRVIIMTGSAGNGVIAVEAPSVTLTQGIEQAPSAPPQTLITEVSSNLTTRVAGANLTLSKVGNGTLFLSTNSSFTSGNLVQGSTILLGGAVVNAGQVAVQNGALFGGNGSLLGSQPLIMSNGSILSPGQPGSAGTLTINRPLMLSNSTQLLWHLSHNDTTIGNGINDLVTGVNSLTLDGVINFSIIGAPTITSPGTYRLFNYTGSLFNNGLIIGSLPLPTGWTANIVAGSGQVNLQVIPEPSAIFLIAASVLLLYFGFGIRKRSIRNTGN